MKTIFLPAYFIYYILVYTIDQIVGTFGHQKFVPISL